MASEWQYLRWGDLATLEYDKGLRDYKETAGQFHVKDAERIAAEAGA